MPYFQGFVVAVPAANKEAYREMAAKAVPLFKEFGATRLTENWEDEVPDGKVTDFKRAVKAEDGEAVVFSWLEYPDKATRDAATAKLMSDPRMEQMGASMPFDATRMIFGGFDALGDDRPDGPMGYVDGMLCAVPAANKDAYRDFAEHIAAVFRDHGATRVVDAWGDDVPDGKITDFKGAVQAKNDEVVVYSWVEWPSKEAHDAGWQKIMADERMQSSAMPFDGQRMVYGGFAPLVDA